MKYIDDLRLAIDKLLSSDLDFYMLGEDICDPYGGAFKVTKNLSSKYPKRLITTPMSEQSFTGMGIGMALGGLKIVVEIMFGDFITLIADQLINHIAKFSQMYELKCNFVVRTPSGGYRGYGATHSQSIEKIFLGIPGIEIIAPNILVSPGELLQTALTSGKPTLFVENKLDYSRELLLDTVINDFINVERYSNYVKCYVEDEIPSLTIITYGGMTSMLLEIQHDIFIKEEIAIEVIVVSNISSINSEDLNNIIMSDKVITVEESCYDFGWGG
jgi:pyruvate/2-oxoglutarate/acetoin dehydrogenase E1 component